MTHSTEHNLIKFRENFNSIRCFQYPDYLIYKTSKYTSAKRCDDANVLIQKLGLPLVAINTSLFEQDSFTVRSNENIDI